MTSAPTAHRNTPPPGDVADGSASPRLQLKPESTAATGFVDGGWWPRSRDLGAELPDLLAALKARIGPFERVSYHLGDWDDTERAITAGGNVVRLSGFRSQTAGTIDVLASRLRMTLLVVPADAASETAHDVLATAGRRDNADDVASLLHSSNRTGEADADGRSEVEHR
jgi:hypothetical protein